MSERNGSTSVGTGTAEIPVVRPDAPAPAVEQTETAAAPASERTSPEGDVVPGMQPTAPVSVRPRPRLPRRGPLTVMGPWAPVAGGLLGLVLGVIAVVFLAGAADRFPERLSLAFVVLGLGMLGTSGVL